MLASVAAPPAIAAERRTVRRETTLLVEWCEPWAMANPILVAASTSSGRACFRAQPELDAASTDFLGSD